MATILSKVYQTAEQCFVVYSKKLETLSMGIKLIPVGSNGETKAGRRS